MMTERRFIRGRPGRRRLFLVLGLLACGGLVGTNTSAQEGKKVSQLSETRLKALVRVPAGHVRNVILSPNGEHMACVIAPDLEPVYDPGLETVIRRKGPTHVICDGTKGLEYDYVTVPVFSDDSKHVAYAGTHRPGGGGPWSSQVVHDGKPGPWFAQVRGPYFVPKGGVLVYQGRDSEDRWYLFRGGKRIGPYVELGGISFSANGKHMAYHACLKKGRRNAIFKDGRIVGEHRRLTDPLLSADGKHIIYAFRFHHWQVCLDRRTTDLPGWPQSLVLSPNGRKWATVHDSAVRDARTGVAANGRVVIQSGKPGPVFEYVHKPVFSPDSSHLTYWALNDGKQFIVCDGKRGPAFDEVGGPVFSPNGQHLAYAARLDKLWFVVCDDKRGRDHALVKDVGFSGDSRHLFYKAAGGEGVFVVCDGIEGSGHGDVWIARNSFIDLKKARYVAMDGRANEATLYEFPWPKNRDCHDGLTPLK